MRPIVGARGLTSSYRRYWLAQTVSSLGNAFTQFALPLLVFELTGSALDLAASTAFTLLPFLLFGVFVGAWVDRVDRRRLMVAVDLANAVAIASIPLAHAVGALDLWWVYAAAFVNSTLALALQTAQFAAIPHLVARKDDLVAANGRLQASFSAARVVGPLLAGALVAVGPLEAVFLVDAASFVFSAATIASIRTSFAAERGAERRSLGHDVAEGLRYVLKHPVLRSIAAMMALLNLANSAALAEVVLFAKDRLAASDTEVAFVFAAGSVGIVVCSLAAAPLRRRLSFVWLVLPALVVDGAVLVLFALNRSYVLALPLWALASGIPLLVHVTNMSLRQRIVPDRLLGRVVSVAGMLAWGAAPLGVLAAGWAISATGDVVLVYAVIGATIGALGLVFSLSALARVDRFPEVEPTAA